MSDLESIDWPEPLKEMQRNWIGKSKGVSVKFKVEGLNKDIEVFNISNQLRLSTIFLSFCSKAEDVIQLRKFFDYILK